jgi:hypothetical protein
MDSHTLLAKLASGVLFLVCVRVDEQQIISLGEFDQLAPVLERQKHESRAPRQAGARNLRLDAKEVSGTTGERSHA